MRDVSLSVPRGSLIALLGPSGCGKTTTLRMVAGLERPDAGRVLVDGRDVTGLPPYARRMGVVFQSYALFPHMSVAANVAFGLGVSAFITPKLMGGGRVFTLATEIYDAATQTLDWPQASALSVYVLVLLALFLAVQAGFSRRVRT